MLLGRGQTRPPQVWDTYKSGDALYAGGQEEDRSRVSYADASRLGLLVAMTFWAAISALGMTKSVHEADAVSAWVWTAVYATSSLLAAWCFERLL